MLVLIKQIYRQVDVYVEIKEPLFHRYEKRSNSSEIVLDTLRKYGYKNRTDNALVQCFEIEELQRIRLQLKSNLRLVGLLKNNEDRSEYIKTNYTYWTSEIRVETMSTYVDGIGPRYALLFEQENTS